jgi:DNA-binding winged helix-turn-helix (wHTH) protein
MHGKDLENVMRQVPSESTSQTSGLAVNFDTRVVSVDGQPIHLTRKEYGILELLSLRKGTTLTKEMFLNHLYDGGYEPGLKIIDVFVCKLRKKLAQATGGNHYIETVWGRGYILRDGAVTAGPQAATADPKHSDDMRFQRSHQPTRDPAPHTAGKEGLNKGLTDEGHGDLLTGDGRG